MTTAKRLNEIRGAPGAPVWQRNCYAHTVRNPQELEIIRDYIRTNPVRWDTDPPLHRPVDLLERRVSFFLGTVFVDKPSP